MILQEQYSNISVTYCNIYRIAPVSTASTLPISDVDTLTSNNYRNPSQHLLNVETIHGYTIASAWSTRTLLRHDSVRGQKRMTSPHCHPVPRSSSEAINSMDVAPNSYQRFGLPPTHRE